MDFLTELLNCNIFCAEIYRIVSQKQIKDSQNEDDPTDGKAVEVIIPSTSNSTTNKQQGCCKNL